jgi:hypothetical protein
VLLVGVVVLVDQPLEALYRAVVVVVAVARENQVVLVQMLVASHLILILVE